MAGRQPDGGAAALLDPALRAAMGLDDDAYGGPAADAVLLPAGKRAKQRPSRPAGPPPAQSRAERRALKSKDRKLASLQVRGGGHAGVVGGDASTIPRAGRGACQRSHAACSLPTAAPAAAPILIPPQDERVRKARRTELLASLAATELAPAQQALLYGSGALGHKLSVRETLQRSLAETALGVASGTLDAGVLAKHAAVLGAAARGGKRGAVDDDEDSDDDDEEDEDEGDDSESSDDDAGGAAAAVLPPRAPTSGAQAAAGKKAPVAAARAVVGGKAAAAAASKRPTVTASAPSGSASDSDDADSSSSSGSDGAPAAAGARRRPGGGAAQPPSKRVRWATDVNDAGDNDGASSSDDSDSDGGADDAMGGDGDSDSDDSSDSGEYADLAGGAWTGLGASDDDDDDEDDEDDEDDDDDDDEDDDDDDDGEEGDDDDNEEEEGDEDDEDDDSTDGDDGDAPPATLSRRRAPAGNPAASSQPSKFSFAVKLPGKAAPAPAPAAAPAAPLPPVAAHASASDAGAPAEAAAAADAPPAAAVVDTNTPSVFQTGAIHEGDPALAKLRALRAANLAAAPAGGRAPQSTWRQAAALGDGDDDEDGEGGGAAASNGAVDPNEERITRYVISEADAAAAAASRAATRAGFTSAADAIAALERGGSGSNADDGTDDRAYWDAYDGKKPKVDKKKGKSFGALSAGGADDDAAAAAAAADPFLAQAARWSADGSTVLPSVSALPPSAYSAYAPLPSTLARPADVEAARRELPVVRAEGDILEAVAGSDVVLLCGETGSGKTTQVPQMLLEVGYGTLPGRLVAIPPGEVGRDAARPHARFRGFPGRIVVTQPRRVAATAMAHRVASELGVPVAPTGPVGYQVRYDAGTVGAGTRLKFVTDGVLLREIAGDLLLRQYSVIIIDEAHERGVNSDVLLGLLSRAVGLRNDLARQQAAELAAGGAVGGDVGSPSSLPLGPLKLIVMSATLRVDDFTGNDRLFPRPAYLPPAGAATAGGGGDAWPPVVVVQARQFPVTAHFARVTNVGGDYVGEAVGKAAKIHARLPPGGILVFLAGSREVEDAVRSLRKRFDPRRQKRREAASAAAAAARPALEDGAAAPPGADGGNDDGGSDQQMATEEGAAPASDADDAPSKPPADGGAADDAAAGEGNDDAAVADAAGDDDSSGAAGLVHVLPLYALLPPAAQQRVFAPPPPGHRLIVVATNVAETSLTIPGIR
jgi:hypothetical protein